MAVIDIVTKLKVLDCVQRFNNGSLWRSYEFSCHLLSLDIHCYCNIPCKCITERQCRLTPKMHIDDDYSARWWQVVVLYRNTFKSFILTQQVGPICLCSPTLSSGDHIALTLLSLGLSLCLSVGQSLILSFCLFVCFSVCLWTQHIFDSNLYIFMPKNLKHYIRSINRLKIFAIEFHVKWS